MRSDRNPTMRHLEKTSGIAIDGTSKMDGWTVKAEGARVHWLVPHLASADPWYCQQRRLGLQQRGRHCWQWLKLHGAPCWQDLKRVKAVEGLVSTPWTQHTAREGRVSCLWWALWKLSLDFYFLNKYLYIYIYFQYIYIYLFIYFI